MYGGSSEAAEKVFSKGKKIKGSKKERDKKIKEREEEVSSKLPPAYPTTDVSFL